MRLCKGGNSVEHWEKTRASLILLFHHAVVAYYKFSLPRGLRIPRLLLTGTNPSEASSTSLSSTNFSLLFLIFLQFSFFVLILFLLRFLLLHLCYGSRHYPAFPFDCGYAFGRSLVVLFLTPPLLKALLSFYQSNALVLPVESLQNFPVFLLIPWHHFIYYKDATNFRMFAKRPKEFRGQYIIEGSHAISR